MHAQARFLPFLLPVLTAAAAAAVFVADTITATDIAISTLNVAVILLAARFCSAEGLLRVAAGCTALAVLRYCLSPPDGPEHESAVNTAISFAAMGITTTLTAQQQRADASLLQRTGLLDLMHEVVSRSHQELCRDRPATRLR